MHVICNPLLRANRHQNVPEVCTLVFVQGLGALQPQGFGPLAKRQ